MLPEQDTADRADKSYIETVDDPGHPQGDHDFPVPATPKVSSILAGISIWIRADCPTAVGMNPIHES